MTCRVRPMSQSQACLVTYVGSRVTIGVQLKANRVRDKAKSCTTLIISSRPQWTLPLPVSFIPSVTVFHTIYANQMCIPGLTLYKTKKWRPSCSVKHWSGRMNCSDDEHCMILYVQRSFGFFSVCSRLVLWSVYEGFTETTVKCHFPSSAGRIWVLLQSFMKRCKHMNKPLSSNAWDHQKLFSRHDV